MDFICLSILASASGIPLKRLLRELEINRKTWDNWLWGITEPNLAQRDRLAELLGCSVADINEAVARSRESWIIYRKSLVIPANDPEEKQRPIRRTAAEIIIQIIVSVATSVVVTLKLLGKL